MKKVISTVLALAMLTAGLTACGDSETKKMVGYWECTGIDFGDGEVVEDLMGYPAAAFLQMELKEDGTATCYIYGEEPEEMKWIYSGDTLTMGEDDEASEFIYENDQLVARDESDGETTIMYLQKVDEFTNIEEIELEEE
ncbi:MAG: hypothetical protein ACI4XB_09230 [Ruminococcus sp.]